MPERWTDVLPAPRDRAQGADQLLGGALLADESAGAGAQEGDRILLLRVGGEDEDREIRLDALDLGQGVDAVQVRHGDVEQHHVARLAADERQRLRAGSRLAHDFAGRAPRR